MSAFSSILAKLGIGSAAAVSAAQVTPISAVEGVVKLEGRPATHAEKLNWKMPIVDLLKVTGLESSLAARQELAAELGCPTKWATRRRCMSGCTGWCCRSWPRTAATFRKSCSAESRTQKAYRSQAPAGTEQAAPSASLGVPSSYRGLNRREPSHAFSLLPIAILAATVISPRAFSDHCAPPRVAKVATAKEIRLFVKGQKRSVLTFTGYSGAEYENKAAMLDQAGKILDRRDPGRTLVNIGATAAGVGAVYQLAKQKGFRTMGIVSTLVRDDWAALSPCVDYVFFVRDRTWGGTLPGTETLAPTSAALVAVSSELVGIGGGEVSRDELLAARKIGKSVEFFPADMNHQMARDKAAKKGKAEPTDFRGAADTVFHKTP